MVFRDISMLEEELQTKVLALDIGQSVIIDDNNNAIKRISKDEYMFIRKGSVDTHIFNFDIEKETNDIDKNINQVLKENDDIQYADQRVKLINKLLVENEWIYDLKSTNRIIKKEIKNKESILSEWQNFDKKFEFVANYLLEPKFKNKNEEKEYEKLQKEKQKLEKINKRKIKTAELDQLDKIINEIQSYRNYNTHKLKNNKKVITVGDLEKREKKGDFIYQEEIKARIKNIKYDYHKKDLDSDYFKMMFTKRNLIPHYDDKVIKSVPAFEMRPSILTQMKEEINKLKERLGMNIKDSTQKQNYIKEFIQKYGKHDYKILKRTYNDLKYDYELAKKYLTDELQLKPGRYSTVYDINSDTWYKNENGEIVEVSKNMISLNDINTYRGLILNYKDLKDKYRDNHHSDWWALLMDFEYILNKTEFNWEEEFVLKVLFDGYTQKQIRDMYDAMNLNNITKDRISRMINGTIPNKLLNTYLDIVQDWLVVKWQIGKYKVCSKCGEAKLANERYFSPDIRNKDGLHSICKKCRT